MNLPVTPPTGKREAESRFSGRRGRRGNNLIEFSLLVPWYIFLFVGALDSGFYAYSLIATQTAAREGALYCSTSLTTCGASGNTDTANSVQCLYALDQLRMLPNIGSGITSCGAGTTTVTNSAPVAIVTASLTSATTPASPDGNPASSVTVVYLTPNLIPIPGLFPGRITITRVVTMRYRT